MGDIYVSNEKHNKLKYGIVGRLELSVYCNSDLATSKMQACTVFLPPLELYATLLEGAAEVRNGQESKPHRQPGRKTRTLCIL